MHKQSSVRRRTSVEDKPSVYVVSASTRQSARSMWLPGTAAEGVGTPTEGMGVGPAVHIRSFSEVAQALQADVAMPACAGHCTARRAVSCRAPHAACSPCRVSHAPALPACAVRRGRPVHKRALKLGALRRANLLRAWGWAWCWQVLAQAQVCWHHRQALAPAHLQTARA